MAITGGIKFFADNALLYDAGGSCVASSGTVVENNCIDKLSYTYWTSVGSNDSTVETLTLTFGSATLTRLLLLDHNWKQFTVQYWNGSSFVDFTSVVGLDGALGGGISESGFADDSAYYEFDAITTTIIKITVTKTQTVNAQKYIATIIATTELATLQGYPTVDPVTYMRNARTMQMLSGRVKIVKQPEVFQATISFKNYPVLTYGADVDAIRTLVTRETPFHMWLCGGRRGSTYFSYPIKGWGLKDCPRVQIDSDFASTWSSNIYKNGQNLGDLVFTEHV